MKKLLASFLILGLFSCTKENPVILNFTKPVRFENIAPDCEQWKATFTGELHGEVYVVTSDTTLDMRDHQLYTVTFETTAPRCSSGELILSDENGQALNIWLGGSENSTQTRYNTDLVDFYWISLLGE